MSLMLLMAALQSSGICLYWFLPSLWKPLCAGLLRVPNAFGNLHPPQNPHVGESFHPLLKQLLCAEKDNYQQLFLSTVRAEGIGFSGLLEGIFVLLSGEVGWESQPERMRLVKPAEHSGSPGSFILSFTAQKGTAELQQWSWPWCLQYQAALVPGGLFFLDFLVISFQGKMLPTSIHQDNFKLR